MCTYTPIGWCAVCNKWQPMFEELGSCMFCFNHVYTRMEE